MSLGSVVAPGVRQSRLVNLKTALLCTDVRHLSCGRAWAHAARQQRRGADRTSLHPSATCSVASLYPQTPLDSDAAPSTQPSLSLSPGEVHLWWLHPEQVDTAAAAQRYSSLLTPEELQDCHRSADPANAKERILARAFVRSVLAQYVAGAPAPRRLLFDRNQHGKPSLVCPSLTAAGHRLHFNLTHTTGIIGLAVSAERLVGLDAESERRKPRDPLRLAWRRFAAEEFQALQASPEGPARDGLFIKLWTLKESYVKALGRGISAPPGLQSFAFRLLGGGRGGQGGSLGQHPAVELQAGRGAGGGPGPGPGTQQAQEQEQGGLAPGTPPATEAGGARHAIHVAAAADEEEGNGAIGSGAHGASSSDCSNSCTCTVSGSESSSSSSIIQFVRSAEAEQHESRRWCFLLLRPSSEHIASMCVECLPGCTEGPGLRVAAFAGMPQEQPQPVELELLGQGDCVCDLLTRV